VVAQPEDRGTAPAILYALLVMAVRQAASDTVVFYSSDHFVSDDVAFSAQIEVAFAGTARAARPGHPARRRARPHGTRVRRAG